MGNRIKNYVESDDFFYILYKIYKKIIGIDNLHKLEKEFNLHIFTNKQEHYKTNLSLEDFLRRMEDKSDFIQIDYLWFDKDIDLYNENKITVYSGKINTITLRKNIIDSYKIIN